MRLIDAEPFREDWLENGENKYVYDTNAVLDSIDAQPTVNPVHAAGGLYCRECGMLHNGMCLRCTAFLKDPDNGFCSFGVPRQINTGGKTI